MENNKEKEEEEEEEQQQSESSINGVDSTHGQHQGAAKNHQDYEPCFPIISVKEWYSSNNDIGDDGKQQPSPPPLALLDVRSTGEWEQWYFAAPSQQQDNKNANNNITVVHIPLHALTQQQRSYELPPRKVPFCLLLSDEEQNNSTTSILAKFLNYMEKPLLVGDDNGGETCTRNNNKNQHHSKRKMRQPWQVKGVILGNAKETLEQAQELGILVLQQPQQQQNETAFATSTTYFQPLPRLWEPDPMIQQVLLPLLVQWMKTRISLEQQQNDDMNNNKTMSTWEIWDLGAGSGRDACFLAEELKAVATEVITTTSAMKNHVDKTPNFRVIAMDQRYRKNTTKQQPNDDHDDNHLHKEEEEAENEQSSPALFWKRRGVANVTDCRQVDLENETEMNTLLTCTSSLVQCIYAVRYWNRPLVQRIANDNGSCVLLKESGAIFAMTTFGKPSVGAAWNFAHPKEKHVLERNELADIFRQSTGSDGQSKWRILHDEVVMDSDHGRTLIQFVAQRV